jgi:isocitrate lyase
MTFVLLDKPHYGVSGVNISVKHVHHKLYIPGFSISTKRSNENKNYNDHAKNEVSS